MNQAKVQLSPLEMELVTNAHWILTKNALLDKVMELLGTVQTEQAAWLGSGSFHLPAAVFHVPARISRGEKYLGLPWLILDQPRHFHKENIFAIRHLFWWGHFFSSTLHLSGDYQARYAPKIAGGFELLQNERFYICTHTDQWQHHFEETNYTPIAGLTKKEFEKLLLTGGFIKIARKIPLQEWEHAAAMLLSNFRLFITLLED